jgi:hypothetical protein
MNAEFSGRIVLDAYFWEYEPFDFSKSFQEQIPNTATFDVVLCLLWSRLGSRLGGSQRLPDGHQVRCHKVVRNGDPSYAMAGGRRDGFFRERLFKDRRVLIHRREPRRFDCRGGAHPDNK